MGRGRVEAAFGLNCRIEINGVDRRIRKIKVRYFRREHMRNPLPCALHILKFSFFIVT